MAKKEETSDVKKLYRSSTEHIIAGVAGGLAEFFNVDATLVRILFVVAALFNGFGVIAYIVLWVLVPMEKGGEVMSEATIRKNVDEIKEKAQDFSKKLQNSGVEHNGRYIGGIILIVLGVSFFLNQYGLFNINLFWPIILVVIGLFILMRR